MTWCRRTRARIGVDVGHHAVKAAQVSGDGRTLEAAVEIPLRQPGVFDEREADRLASTLRRKDFAEAPVCVIAPAKATLASVIELPPESPGVPVDMLASAEAARVHRLAPHSFELAYWRLPVSKRANRIPPALTVVLPHEQSHPLVDSLTRAGLDVDAVDVWVAAAARICRRLMPPAPALTLILDIGASASRIALTCGDWVLAMREIPEAALSRDLPAGQVPAVIDTVAAELNSSLAYAQQQFPDHAVEQLLVVGHGASAPGVMESLAEGFAIPVIRATPQSLIAADPEASEAQASPAFTLAIGAARFGEAA